MGGIAAVDSVPCNFVSWYKIVSLHFSTYADCKLDFSLKEHSGRKFFAQFFLKKFWQIWTFWSPCSWPRRSSPWRWPRSLQVLENALSLAENSTTFWFVESGPRLWPFFFFVLEHARNFAIIYKNLFFVFYFFIFLFLRMPEFRGDIATFLLEDIFFIFGEH